MALKHSTYLILLLSILLAGSLFSQKTGLVLSGGGASGIAHIGVLKALEENNIPIDYITGTSIGAFVGGLYAVGYSPKEMEAMVNSEEFRNMVYGKIENRYIYYFKKKDENASWINLKLSLDSAFETNLPTNLISAVAMDFSIMEIFGPPSAGAAYSFDSLYIPFRCVASDVYKKKSVIFKSGDLGEAIRASMSYPFYVKPISVEGKLLFDGGLYNNFPSDVMYDDFFPDYIIGSNVTGNVPPPKEDNLISQVKCMLVNKTNYTISCEAGIIIEPKADVGLFDFDNAQELIDSGYAATIRHIDEIKKYMRREVTPLELSVKRNMYKSKLPPLVFESVKIRGLTPLQSNYVTRLLLPPKNKSIHVADIKSNYFRLMSDDKIKYIFPKAVYNTTSKKYDLTLDIKKEKDITAEIGGNFSNRPVSIGYLGFQYNYLGNTANGFMANMYFGKLYTSVQLKTRIDFPYKVSFFLEPNLTYNRWDYFKSSSSFFEDVKPAYLIHRERYGEINIGFPSGNKGKLMAGAGLSYITDKYYQTEQFSQNDTADRTDFNTFTSSILYEINSLNRKQYATKGALLLLKLRYIQGEEFHEPGSTSSALLKRRKIHEWPQIKLVYDHYYKGKGTLRLGFYAEGMYSTQTLFSNYTASVLSAPAFQPSPESKTLFLENYRAHKYMACGLKALLYFKKGFEFRLEGYTFLPYQSILKNTDLTALYGGAFDTKHFISTATALYQTPIGPLSLSLNYYDRIKDPLSLLFHFGYVIFNRRSLD